MECEYCNEIKRKVYEDNNLIAFLKENPASTGHIVIIPKKHYTILEQVPDEIAAEMFHIANQISSILFEVFGAEGTNILIQNGTEAGQTSPHLSLNILPRKQGDTLNFNWEPKTLDKEKASVIELKLKKECGKIVIGKKEEKAKEIKEDKEEIKNSNWINKILQRLP